MPSATRPSISARRSDRSRTRKTARLSSITRRGSAPVGPSATSSSNSAPPSASTPAASSATDASGPSPCSAANIARNRGSRSPAGGSWAPTRLNSARLSSSRPHELALRARPGVCGPRSALAATTPGRRSPGRSRGRRGVATRCRRGRALAPHLTPQQRLGHTGRFARPRHIQVAQDRVGRGPNGRQQAVDRPPLVRAGRRTSPARSSSCTLRSNRSSAARSWASRCSPPYAPTNVSGSSPSGSVTTRTATPLRKSSSPERKVARSPARSLS